MSYAKYISAQAVQLCPTKGHSASNGTDHTNLPRFYAKNPQTAAADGYLPFVETTPPTPTEGYAVSTTYAVVDGEIIQSHTLVAVTPQPDVDALAQTVESNSERLDVVEGAIIEASEILYA